MMLHSRRALALLLLAATACTTGPNPMLGSYTLNAVNDGALPYVTQVGTATHSLNGATLTVSDDGSWVESFTWTHADGAASWTRTELDAGHWMKSRDRVMFDSVVMGSNGFTGTYVDGVLTLDDGAGRMHVFKR
ncbi:MAG TPA: hypothetical protein VFI52_00480 [Gemmatimonadaceae bacterium]|nr:hypothetical protein [Gemmatimonadaceae bacterium]